MGYPQADPTILRRPQKGTHQGTEHLLALGWTISHGDIHGDLQDLVLGASIPQFCHFGYTIIKFVSQSGRYQQISARQARAAVHQAQIHALRARVRRLPTRAKRLQRRLVARQAKQRWYRRWEQTTLKEIERLRQRATHWHHEAVALREEAQAVLALANSPVALGQTRLIVLRGDAGLGTADTITLLCERGYLFVLKGRDPRTAYKLVDLVTPADWVCVDAHLRAAEIVSAKLTGCPYPVRLVLCERTDEHGRLSYYCLVSNLSREMYDTAELVKFYNGRQTIEAFNKELSRKRRAENGRKYRARWEMRIGKQHVSDHRGQHG